MVDNYKQFEQRKRDHIELALRAENQANESNPFQRVQLLHEALPDLNFEAIEITGERFGNTISKPFLVSSMTAGHADAGLINMHLIAACAETGWAMGVGSQRRELTDKQAAHDWHTLRTDFPSVRLFSNLGIAQLITTSPDAILRLTDALQAEALIVHCNPLQEVLQPEGTPLFQGCWKALADIIEVLPLPVIVKETGCGFSKATLQRLHDIGVAAVDVSGLGGTHWGRIEGQRATDNVLREASHTFKSWGIDTIQSVLNANEIASPLFEVWGSGGVRNGLDAAKLFSLGATMVGFAKPMLEAALQSRDDVVALMELIEYELRVAMFCTGSQKLSDLRGRHVING